MGSYNCSAELVHYGVKGMKWGVRRAKKQLSRLSGRKRSDITDEEAEDFRQDVKYAKKHKGVSVRINPSTRTITNFYDHKNREIGEAYANMVMRQSLKDKQIGALMGTTAAMVGASVIGTMLGNLK